MADLRPVLVLDWDPVRFGYPIKLTTHKVGFPVPEDLADHFKKAVAAKDQELSRVRDDLPLKEGFDALVYGRLQTKSRYRARRPRGTVSESSQIEMDHRMTEGEHLLSILWSGAPMGRIYEGA